METESKIYQFDLLESINQNVFGFDISVDDIALVQIAESLCDY